MAVEFYDGMAETNGNFTPPAAGTVCLWFCELGWNVSVNRLFGSSDSFEIKVNSVSKKLINELCKTTGTDGSATIPNGTWTHIACDYNTSDGAGHGYVNGAIDSTTTGHTVSVSAGKLGIGGRYGAGAGTLSYGILEDVRVYNRVLSAAEILIIYGCRGSDCIVNGLVDRWLVNDTPGGEGILNTNYDVFYDHCGGPLWASCITGNAYYWGSENMIRRGV